MILVTQVFAGKDGGRSSLATKSPRSVAGEGWPELLGNENEAKCCRRGLCGILGRLKRAKTLTEGEWVDNEEEKWTKNMTGEGLVVGLHHSEVGEEAAVGGGFLFQG